MIKIENQFTSLQREKLLDILPVIHKKLLLNINCMHSYIIDLKIQPSKE